MLLSVDLSLSEVLMLTGSLYFLSSVDEVKGNCCKCLHPETEKINVKPLFVIVKFTLCKVGSLTDKDKVQIVLLRVLRSLDD